MIRTVTFDAPASQEVRAAAAAACGIQNMHLGRSNEGVDCAGCCDLVWRRFGIDCNLPSNYALRWWNATPERIFLHVEQTLGWPKVLAGPAMPLDLLVFAVATRRGDHCGVLTGQGMFVHCWDECSTESRLTDELSRTVRWIDRLVAVYRPQCPASK